MIQMNNNKTKYRMTATPNNLKKSTDHFRIPFMVQFIIMVQFIFYMCSYGQVQLLICSSSCTCSSICVNLVYSDKLLTIRVNRQIDNALHTLTESLYTRISECLSEQNYLHSDNSQVIRVKTLVIRILIIFNKI